MEPIGLAFSLRWYNRDQIHTEKMPENVPPFPSHVHIYVPYVDATYQRALDAGATSDFDAYFLTAISANKDKKLASKQAPVKKDDEDKRGGVKDAGDTTWWIATKVE